MDLELFKHVLRLKTMTEDNDYLFIIKYCSLEVVVVVHGYMKDVHAGYVQCV